MRHRNTILTATSTFALLMAATPVLAQDGGQLAPGQSLQGALEAGADDADIHHDFWIDLIAGQRVEIVLRSEAFDSLVEVIDQATGEVLDSNDDGFPEGLDSKLRFTAPSAGRYTVRAQSLSGDEAGEYTLSVSELAPPPAPPEPGQIRLGQTVSGRLDVEDPTDNEDRPFEAYAFQMGAGDRVTVRMSSDDLDSLVQIGTQVGSTFETLAENDDDTTGDTLNSRLVFEAPHAGRFVVRALPLSSGDEGDYRLSLEEGPAPIPTRPLVLGADATDGELSENDPKNEADQTVDAFSLQVREGQRIEVTVESSDFDTYVSVYGPDSNLVGEDDDGGATGTNSRLVFVADTSGSYRVEVRAFSEDNFGEYEIAAKEIAPPPPPTPLAFGATLEREISDTDPQDDGGRHYDAFSFSGSAGRRVQITMRSGDFDSFLQIGKAGDEFEALASDDDGLREGVDSRLNFTLPEDGTYEIRAMPLGTDGDGLYSIELVDKGPKPNPGSLLIGETARGRLTESDSMDEGGTYYDDWTFQAKEGDELELIMVSNDVDSMVSVGRLSDEGDFSALASDDDGLVDVHARLEWTVPDDGTYVVRAQSFAPNQTGVYALIVSKSE